MRLGQGRAAAIDENDIAALATELKCHPADLEAIAEVESNGFGWFRDGRIKILFEKHWFYKLVNPIHRTKAVNAGVARKDWISPAKGGYKDQNTADQRYDLLTAAIALDEEAAFQSVSVGRFQIMGFNYLKCGFTSAKEMFLAFCDDEANQLLAFKNFLCKEGLVRAIQTGDFERVEKVYNGGGLNGEYALKMHAKARELRVAKWAQWPNDWPGKIHAEPVVIEQPSEPLPAPKPGPFEKPPQTGVVQANRGDDVHTPITGDKPPPAPISVSPSVPVGKTSTADKWRSFFRRLVDVLNSSRSA